ncbi:MAG TPA: imidazole glycerol phosphate synthase subunit HisH [Chthoniobacteraceae bacterium]|jgi:glutamine amidotransferase
MLALIDYGSGNIRSVHNALQHEGAAVELVSTPADLEKAKAVLLPGVGAFGDCVRGLQSRSLWEPLREWLAADRPFLGICVGYQLLFDESEESPGVRGFGHFGGQVKRFSSPGLKVPQIGWNSLEIADTTHPLWRGMPPNPHVYFVHSYFPVPEDPQIISASSTYGETFAAGVASGNVAAVQFHPEKSQQIGLGILRNFIQAAGVTAPVTRNILAAADHDL